jgi:hypothetical protein
MRKLFIYSLLALGLVTSTAYAASPEDVAMTFVQQYHFGQNLPVISYLTATRTQTYAMIVKELGEQKAQSLVKGEIDKVLPAYQNQWDANLAASYAQVFSKEQLQSLVDEGKASRYLGDLKSKQSDVGALMQAKSTGLLKELVSKAMLAAFLQTVPK